MRMHENLLGDGRRALTFVGLSLVLCGGFALVQSATGRFLPHDVKYLGMDAQQLCALHQCRVVHFMFHDRVAFGGVLIALGLLYVWLSEFALRAREAWAWWAMAVSGTCGFASFLTCIGTGYLDKWHGIATALLLPCFVAGLIRARALVTLPGRGLLQLPGCVRSRLLLLVTAAGLTAAGFTISFVGATRVFVPQDFDYMGLNAAELRAINSRLIPVIAHDRAGFGGGLFACGVAWLFCVRCGRSSRHLWWVLCASGVIGFTAAIGVHLVVGYINVVHLGPAILGALIFVVGIAHSFKPMCQNATDEVVK